MSESSSASPLTSIDLAFSRSRRSRSFSCSESELRCEERPCAAAGMAFVSGVSGAGGTSDGRVERDSVRTPFRAVATELARLSEADLAAGIADCDSNEGGMEGGCACVEPNDESEPAEADVAWDN